MVAASSGCLMASRIEPAPRTARYSGRLRPAWRMNHTGVCPVTCPSAAARNGEEVRVDMAARTLLAASGDASGDASVGEHAATVTRPLFGARRSGYAPSGSPSGPPGSQTDE